MVGNNKTYMYGSVAKQLEYYEQDTKPTPIVRRKPKNKNTNKYKFQAICTVLVLFAAFFVIITRYAMITELNYNLENTKKMYNKTVNNNAHLKVSIDRGTNLSVVREIAETKLGMHIADKNQITYVSIPKVDYTEISLVAKNEEQKNNSIFAVLTSKANQVTRFLE